ncbi:MAG: hypothetical protein GY866_14015, partial [Proteobacteria bacterium]|nr:hypothetical protein [Pseudomonadota bacterium]
KESSVPGKAFEDQLIETVQKLQTMGNEIDAMMESTQPRNADVIDKNVNLKHKKIDTIVENFSAAKKSSAKSAKYVASQYEQIGMKNRS